MSPEKAPSDYGKEPFQPMTWVVGAFVLLVLFAGLMQLEICEEKYYFCANTGSTYGYTESIFGMKSGYRQNASELEEFVRKTDPGAMKNRWRKVNGTGKNIFGKSISFAHGGAPATILFRKHKEKFSDWMRTHSDVEKRALYDFLVKADDESAFIRVKEIVGEPK